MMVEILYTTDTTASSSSFSVPSTHHPDPCPFCQLDVDDEYSLLLHIETEHSEDFSPFREPDNVSIDTGDSVDYILCPEEGCEEYIHLLELQTHMDFHDAEHLSMMEQTAAANDRERERSRERRHHHHHHRRREGEQRSGDRDKDGARHHHHHHHRPRENRGGDHAQRSREKGKEKDGKVTFISPSSQSRSGLSWFEKVALAIAPPQHILPDQPRGRKYRSESVGPPRRSDSMKPAGSVRRSDSKRASDGKKIELRKGEPRKLVAPPTPVPAERSSKSSGIRKLGKSDLGPYAHEDRMPDWLRTELEKGGKVINVRKIDPATGRLMNVVQIANETPDLIPTIALLSERDPEIVRTYLCHPGTKHVGKQISKEGGFCGYRNIQMLISYIQAAFPRGSHPFEGRIPTILKMQDLIEEGWAKGINSTAKLETGGIKGTRKYIGTSEAQTLLTSVGLRSRARAFIKSTDPNATQTQDALLAFIEDYFAADIPADSASSVKVVGTSKPPIYLQHSGHSMTIVGMEKWRDGSSSLLVFDPFFSPTDAIKNLAGAKKLGSRVRPEVLLKVYRRKMNYLAKYKEFEIILLDP